MDLKYSVTSNKSFDEAVSSIKAETEKVGFRVLHVHDVAATLDEKGFKIEPLKIIEICNAKYAYEAISTDIDLSLMLPCKINVYVKDQKTVISGLRPTILLKLFQKSEIKNFAEEVDTLIRKIIDNSK